MISSWRIPLRRPRVRYRWIVTTEVARTRVSTFWHDDLRQHMNTYGICMPYEKTSIGSTCAAAAEGQVGCTRSSGPPVPTARLQCLEGVDGQQWGRGNNNKNENNCKHKTAVGNGARTTISGYLPWYVRIDVAPSSLAVATVATVRRYA